MNHLDVALAARAHERGRGIRAAALRHRRLVTRPVAVVLWQLGAEPFSAAAIGWGSRSDNFELSVAGEPRNRDLAFSAMLRFAKWFNPRFEGHAEKREMDAEGRNEGTIARTAPQILVANTATAQMLGRLGRRLAYLPTEGAYPADPELVKLGRHLLFLWDHFAIPGQQLLVSLTDLLNQHWTTGLSELECQSLAALDAYIQPPRGTHGFDAATRVEQESAGPVPAAEDDDRLDPLVDIFNQNRKKQTNPAVVRKLLGPFVDHYEPLTERAWRLIWRCYSREMAYEEARSVQRRWDEDRRAYTSHIEWLAQGGRRRTRHTPRRAMGVLRRLEEATQRVQAEEACDDPVRMIPYLLQNKAVRGRVIEVNRDNFEVARVKRVRRPIVRLLSPDPFPVPTGKQFWWTEEGAGKEFVVESVTPAKDGTQVALKLLTSSRAARLPTVGDTACFSIHSLGETWFARLPATEPWTHRSAEAINVASIERENQED